MLKVVCRVVTCSLMFAPPSSIMRHSLASHCVDFGCVVMILDVDVKEAISAGGEEVLHMVVQLGSEHWDLCN